MVRTVVKSSPPIELKRRACHQLRKRLEVSVIYTLQVAMASRKGRGWSTMEHKYLNGGPAILLAIGLFLSTVQDMPSDFKPVSKEKLVGEKARSRCYCTDMYTTSPNDEQETWRGVKDAGMWILLLAIGCFFYQRSIQHMPSDSKSVSKEAPSRPQ